MAKGDVRKIVDLFKEYYISINKISELNIKVSESLAKKIEDFCDKIREHTNSPLQDDYLRRYMEFQWNRHYKKRGVRGGRGEGSGIKITWIMTKESWKLWTEIDRPRIEAFKVRKGLKGNVKLIDFKKQKENYNEIILKLIPEEEKVKKKFHNTRKGLTLCTGITLMFNHHSELCCSCIFTEECKEILKEEYPKIHKKRGYE